MKWLSIFNGDGASLREGTRQDEYLAHINLLLDESMALGTEGLTAVSVFHEDVGNRSLLDQSYEVNAL